MKSSVTGSSVFDFNGDGAAEVVYNDECYFRVYDGTNGNVLFAEPSESRTRIEYPVVADVDNDGNAEIVFGVSNESGFCENYGGGSANNPLYNNGLEVWGDAGDFWVSARRIWNQHAYHVTNITESARVPLFEPKAWREADVNGRAYNSYRSNPRSFGVAPDLIVESAQVTASTGGCGQVSDSANISAKITNIGDLRVGPGVVLGFFGQWGSAPFEPLLDGVGNDLVSILGNTLEPQDALFVTVPYQSSYNGELQVPDRIRLVIDDDQRERECNESNNTFVVEVSDSSGPATAELRVELGAPTGCTPGPTVSIEVFNEGNVEATNITVRFFAGDPEQGGTPIQEVVLAGPIVAGTSQVRNIAVNGSPQCVTVQIFAIVDPANAIAECNDGNNKARATGTSFCCSG
ncbi:MAG: CARDB domain-containing protein [Myxococcota bacterium]